MGVNSRDWRYSMLAVSVDIEDWYHLPYVTGSPFSKYRNVDQFFEEWDGRYDFLSEPCERALKMLDDLNTRATFFIVGDIVDNYPGLVEKIVEHGHEIACHGLHHECAIDSKTKRAIRNTAEFEKNVMEAKKKLEKIGKEKIIGFRAPSAYIGGWMIDSLEKLGFKYDSSVSINSLYNKCDEKPKNVTTIPYHPVKGGLSAGGKREILEIPWPYWKVLGIKFPTGGGPMLRFFGARYTMFGLNQSLKRGDSVFYFHPIDISWEKFPVGFSSKRPFFWVIKGKTVEKRIRFILKNIECEKGLCKDIWEKTR